MPEIIFDGCVISNFALADSLSLLQPLFRSEAVITGFVEAEVMRGIQAGHLELTRIRDAVKDGWLGKTALAAGDESSLFERLSVSLGLGEASSIAVAKVRGLVLACDDKTARREAGLLGVRLTGTLGILKKAARKGLVGVDEGDRRLELMKAHGYHATINSLRDIPD
jgi:predicted nucleic acid-binding protein